MNTMDTIINSVKQNINETVINDLAQLGFEHDTAVKLVVESDFDIIASAEEYPVEHS